MTHNCTRGESNPKDVISLFSQRSRIRNEKMKISYFLISLVIVMVILSEIFYVMGQRGLLFVFESFKMTLSKISAVRCLGEKISL